jgi:plastocyanin
VAAEAAGPVYEESPGRDEEAVSSATEARHSRAARKRAKRGDVGPWERVRSLRVPTWLIVMPVMVIGVGVLAYLILSSGSSGVTGGGITESTPDPRVAGLTPDDTISVNVNDVNFSSTELSGNAGDVIEILVTNTGTMSHNLVVAGPDDEYDTGDDFEPQPWKLDPGDTGRVVLKIDDPGTYLFRCAFHPTIEFGTLTLE